jgi:hypothetical protein
MVLVAWLAGGHKAACPNGPGAYGMVLPHRDHTLALRYPAEAGRQQSQLLCHCL